jgi:hypothetical protein
MIDMEIADTDRLTCPAEVLSRVLDGEAVLLHLGSGTYFGMNEVATRAWELIVGGTTFAGLCSSLREEFEVPDEELERDLREFVDALSTKQLITIARVVSEAP